MPAGQALDACQDAANAHRQVADAHLWQAQYWQEAPHNSLQHQSDHERAERSHRDKAERIDSTCGGLRTYYSGLRYHSIPDLDAQKQRSLNLKRDAEAGLMQLRASNAYIQLAKRVTDHPREAEIVSRLIISHGKQSLEHTPYNVQRSHTITAQQSISDGKEGIRRAKQRFQDYRDGEKRKSGEASSSNTHHH